MEETLDIRYSNNTLQIFQNPHLMYTISKINSVTISFEAIFNFGRMIVNNLDSGLVGFGQWLSRIWTVD